MPQTSERRASLAAAVVLALLPAASLASNCAGTSTGRTPLTDLGAGLYLGQFEGGLYPGGTNALPPDHAAAGLAAAGAIVPRALDGTPDPAGGKVVLISIGMSNTTAEFCIPGSGTTGCTPESFMGQAAADPAVNHTTLAIVNGARGGQDASTWLDPSGSNYDAVATLLAGQSLSEAQVQAVWVKEADAGPTTALPSASADARTLEGRLGAIARAVKVRYPNVQQVFFSSRIYAGYASTTLNPEPYAYESGFAVKWLVEAQITQMATGGHPPDPVAGDLDYGTVAPWIAWGPYLWADGTTPRSDGLTWVCSDFQSDGTHPATSAVQKVGGMLLAFFLGAPPTEPWFAAAGATTTTTTPGGSTTTTTLPSGCPPAPVAGCLAPGRARLSLAGGTSADGRKLQWKWTGSGVAKADFGLPTSATSYGLCLYDASGLRLSAVAPAGGTCGTRPCWSDVASGFRYLDPALTPDGIATLVLATTSAGGGKIAGHGKGANLPAVALPLALPVRAQVRRSGASTCWEETFGTVLRKDGRRFRARSE